MPAANTGEGALIGSVLVVDRSASTTPFGGVARIYQNDRYASKPGFVFDKATELSECPIMQASSLLASGLNARPNVPEVFKPYRSARALRLANKSLRDYVVGVGLESPLPSGKLPEPSFCGLCAASLKSSAATSEMRSDLLDAFAGMRTAVAVESDVHDAEINTQHAFDTQEFRVRHVTDAGQVPLATYEHQVNFALAEGEQCSLVLTAYEGYLFASCQRPNTHSVVTEETKDAIIVGLCGVLLKGPLSLTSELVGTGDLGNAENGRLSGQTVHTANLTIGHLVKIESPKGFRLEGLSRKVVASLIASYERLTQQMALLRRWQ